MFSIKSSVLKDRLKKFKKAADILFEKDGIVLNETAIVTEEEVISEPPYVIKNSVQREITAKLSKSHILAYEGTGKKFKIDVKLFRRFLSEKDLRFEIRENELRIAANFRGAVFFN